MFTKGGGVAATNNPPLPALRVATSSTSLPTTASPSSPIAPSATTASGKDDFLLPGAFPRGKHLAEFNPRTHFGPECPIPSGEQNVDGSYNYTGIDANGDAVQTRLFDCSGTPAFGGS